MTESAFRCRSCGSVHLRPVVDLGVMPSANAYRSPTETRPEAAFPLRTVVCADCFLVQLDFDMPPHDLFTDYAYFSSYSAGWVAHAGRFVDAATTRLGLGEKSQVIEVASNDGYLLKHFVAKGVPVLGIEPAENVAKVARAAGVPTEARFFGLETAADLVARGLAADLIVGNNVLAHVPDLNDFIQGLAKAVKPTGWISLEFPHLLRLIAEVQFDTIYHEHFSYFSLVAIERAMRRHGLAVIDVEELPTHGGSLRLWLSLQAADRVETPAVNALRVAEKAAGLDNVATFEGFAAQVNACRASFHAFLATAKAEGKTIVGYGAAAKGNTLLNFCGAGPGDIAYVVDRNPHKQDRLLPGSGIPIYAPERIFETRPDYLLILPWNLKREIMEQMAGVRDWGGRFVTPVPEIAIHS